MLRAIETTSNASGLVLPLLTSHLFPNSMGVKVTAQNAPQGLKFSALFDYNCFVAALRDRGIHVYETVPALATLVKTRTGRTSNAALELYKRYVDRRSRVPPHPDWPYHPLEDIIYRALRPSPRLLAHARRILDADADLRHGDFGCVHARVENDMRRWWYHAGKVKPLSLSTVLDLLNTIEPVRTKAHKMFTIIGRDSVLRQQSARARTAFRAMIAERDMGGHI